MSDSDPPPVEPQDDEAGFHVPRCNAKCDETGHWLHAGRQ